MCICEEWVSEWVYFSQENMSKGDATVSIVIQGDAQSSLPALVSCIDEINGKPHIHSCCLRGFPCKDFKNWGKKTYWRIDNLEHTHTLIHTHRFRNETKTYFSLLHFWKLWILSLDPYFKHALLFCYKELSDIQTTTSYQSFSGGGIDRWVNPFCGYNRTESGSKSLSFSKSRREPASCAAESRDL